MCEWDYHVHKFGLSLLFFLLSPMFGLGWEFDKSRMYLYKLVNCINGLSMCIKMLFKITFLLHYFVDNK